MRNRYSILIYWFIFTLPVVIMTSLAMITVRKTLGVQFTDWWVLTTPKLIFITIVTAMVGTLLGIPLARILVRSAPPLTLKGSLGVFSLTAIGVTLQMLFSLIVGFRDTSQTNFFIGFATIILLITFALCIAIFYLKQ